jgi:hypothetical protein
VTAAAPLRFKQAPALCQLGHAGDFALLVAAPAGGANVLPRQQRLLPELNFSMRVLLIGGQALPAVTDRAAEPGG